MKKILIFLLIVFAGCASKGRVVKLSDQKINTKKIVAFNAPPAPWVYKIQQRLEKKGFKVLRWGTTTKVTEQVDQDASEEFNQAATRYLVVIDGYAPYDAMNRCFDGGFYFHYINVDLVDTRANKTLVNVNGAGFSEGCKPMSGTIFTDITDAIANMWY